MLILCSSVWVDPLVVACQALPSYCATWRGNQNGYRCSSSALPISGWRFCGALSDRYCSCGVLLTVSVFQVPRLFFAGSLFSIPEGCGLDCISLPELETLHCRVYCTCTAGLSAPPLSFGVCTCTASLSSPPLWFWSCQIKTVYFTRNWISSFCTVTVMTLGSGCCAVGCVSHAFICGDLPRYQKLTDFPNALLNKHEH